LRRRNPYFLWGRIARNDSHNGAGPLQTILVFEPPKIKRDPTRYPAILLARPRFNSPVYLSGRAACGHPFSYLFARTVPVDSGENTDCFIACAFIRRSDVHDRRH
jgi:hypothetical protein